MIRYGKDSVPSNFVSCSDELIYDVRGNEARGAGDLPNTTVSTMRRLARGICQFTRMKDMRGRGTLGNLSGYEYQLWGSGKTKVEVTHLTVPEKRLSL